MPKNQTLSSARSIRGWNSYDSYGCSIDEAEFRANAKAMAEKLLPHGYDYACIDGLWYYDSVTSTALAGVSSMAPWLDEHGRLLPSPARFPSSVGGAGFKPLADYVHGLGLKFGIHLMRGIPRLAVERKLPLAGSRFRADEVADTTSRCAWENTMYGVDAGKPGAQEWYDGLLELVAGWGVDFLKVDDCGNTPYHRAEVELLHRAVKRQGRPIALSLSPGIEIHEILTAHPHVAAHSDLWRISADIWDKWDNVKYLFPLCAVWSGAIGPDSFPDADMLPYGMMGLGNTPTKPTRKSRLTEDEIRTHFTLLVMARSPLLFGGDVTQLDDFTLGVLAHPEVLHVHAHSRNNRPLWIWQLDNKQAAWKADDASGVGSYLAVFNLSDEPADVTIDLAAHGFGGRVQVRDLWACADRGMAEKTLASHLPPHACGLYKLSAG